MHMGQRAAEAPTRESEGEAGEIERWQKGTEKQPQSLGRRGGQRDLLGFPLPSHGTTPSRPYLPPRARTPGRIDAPLYRKPCGPAGVKWVQVHCPILCQSLPSGTARGGGGDHGFPLYVKSICSQQLRSDGTSLAVVHNVPLRSIALRVGGLPTGTSVSQSCDRKVPMVF